MAPAAATVTVDNEVAARAVTRPLAVLEERGRTRVFLWGTESEVEALAGRLGVSVVANRVRDPSLAHHMSCFQV